MRKAIFLAVTLGVGIVLLAASPADKSKTYSVSDLASSQPLYTGESTPQAELIFGAGSFAPAPGASTVTVSIPGTSPPCSRGCVSAWTPASPCSIAAPSSMPPAMPSTSTNGW